jgi:hypothetical protein
MWPLAAQKCAATDTFPMPFRLDLRADHPWAISGTVADREGRPMANADVSVFAELPESSVPLLAPISIGTTKADHRGRFSMTVPSLPHDQFDEVWAVARGEGHGVAAFPIEAFRLDYRFDFILPKQREVAGRVLAPDGTPVAGVAVLVDRVTDAQGNSLKGVAGAGSAWPAASTTDELGGFDVSGIPSSDGDQTIRFRVDDERFAPQDWTFTLKPGETELVTLQTAEPRIVTGTVLHQDTKSPMAGAWLQVVLSDSSQSGDLQHLSREARTDAAGRFRVRCAAGESLVAYVYPPEGSPYPSWTMDRRHWPEGAREQDLTIEVPRGVLLRGRVLEEGTERPVAGAGVVYWVQRGRNPHLPRHVEHMTYWASEYRSVVSDDDGRVELAVLPGRGYLLAKAPTRDFISRQVSFLEAQGRDRGHYLYNAESLSFFDFTKDHGREDVTREVTIAMRRGADVRLRVKDPDGQPVEQAVLLDPSYTQIRTRYDSSSRTLPLRDGGVTVNGCDPDAVRVVYVLDVARQLGATVRIDPADVRRGEKQVRLQPCGSVRVRITDNEGMPLANRPVYGSGLLLRADLIARESADRPELGPNNTVRFISWSMSTLDRDRQRNLKTDEKGVVVFPTLVPDAEYRLIGFQPTYQESEPFRAGVGETVELSLQFNR